MALQGDVTTVPVRELLAWLARRRATGILSLSRGMEVWRFQLRALPVYVWRARAARKPQWRG